MSIQICYSQVQYSSFRWQYSIKTTQLHGCSRDAWMCARLRKWWWPPPTMYSVSQQLHITLGQSFSGFWVPTTRQKPFGRKKDLSLSWWKKVRRCKSNYWIFFTIRCRVNFTIFLTVFLLLWLWHLVCSSARVVGHLLFQWHT